MPDSITAAIVAIISSGAISGALKLYIDNHRRKQEDNAKNIDDRITAWQALNTKCDEKLTMVEDKLRSYERDFRILHKHIIELERILVRVAPEIEIPQMKQLENM